MTLAVTEWASRGVREVAEFLWPRRCPGCGRAPGPQPLLCAGCLGRIPRLATPVCIRCLAAGADDPRCARHPGFTVWPAWSYDERAARVVEAFKFEQRTDLAAGLVRELARVMPRGFRADAVTGIPLHPARRRERGYNPSERLAAGLARVAGAPHVADVLERVRATRPQSRLGPRARRTNLREAFRVRAPEAWRGRRVLVVDDVVTTGATLESAIATLRAVGAETCAITLAWAQ